MYLTIFCLFGSLLTFDMFWQILEKEQRWFKIDYPSFSCNTKTNWPDKSFLSTTAGHKETKKPLKVIKANAFLCYRIKLIYEELPNTKFQSMKSHDKIFAGFLLILGLTKQHEQSISPKLLWNNETTYSLLIEF